MSYQKLNRDQIAERVAQDIPDGAYVNLGIGLPTKISKYLPADKDVFLHSENGLLAFGPPPAKGKEDPELINAGKEYVTMLTGGCFFHHGDSFAMMRGGHLDIAVLGAFQVAANGDLANWHTGAADAIPAVHDLLFAGDVPVRMDRIELQFTGHGAARPRRRNCIIGARLHGHRRRLADRRDDRSGLRRHGAADGGRLLLRLADRSRLRADR